MQDKQNYPAQASAARDGFLILGMHRSGTSAVSGTLARLGATPPKTLIGALPQNQKGFWESAPITDLHNELLASAGSKWDDWRPFNLDWYHTPVAAQFRERAKTLLASEFCNSPAFVLKDPRICRFAKFWLNIFDEEGITSRVVMPVRIPLEVAQSLKTRDGFPLTKGLLLWLRHTLDGEAATRHLSRVVLPWDAFLKDWRIESERIAMELGVRWPKLTDFAAIEIHNFLTSELKHERSSVEAARAHPDMHEWFMRTYDALMELARSPDSNTATATLDDIRAKFEDAGRLFGRALAENEALIQCDAIAAERDGLVARISELEESLKALRTERDQNRASLQSQRLHMDAQQQALQATINERIAEAEAANARARILEDRASILERKLAQLRMFPMRSTLKRLMGRGL